MDARSQDMDDVELIRRYVESQDRDAMGVLFERHSDLAYRMALRIVRNPSDAEDAVQMAFVKIMRDAANYRGGQGVSGWVVKVVVGTSKDRIREKIRRRQRETAAAEEEEHVHEGEPEPGMGAELREKVRQALDRLPDRYRLPIWMHHYEGLPFEQVALALDMPENTARSQARRGLEMVRASLARAGASVPAVSVLGALTEIPMESAPSGLTTSIAEIAHGLGRWSEAAMGSQPAAEAVRTAALGTKTLMAAAVVTLTAAALGTAVWLAREAGEPEPTRASQAPAAASGWFRDDFENGLGRWSPQPNCSPAEGQGVGGSRCMRVATGQTPSQFVSTSLTPLFAAPQEDIEVRFRIRFEAAADPVIAVGLVVIGQGSGAQNLLRLPLGHGIAAQNDLRGKWLEYVYTLKDGEAAWRMIVDGQERRISDATGVRDRIAVKVSGSRVGILVDSLRAATIYIDDVSIGPPAGARDRGKRATE